MNESSIIQKKMFSTVILGGLIPFTLFLLLLYLNWFGIFEFNISNRINYWVLVFFLCLSFLLFLSFIHIVIPTKNPRKCKTKSNSVTKTSGEKKDEIKETEFQGVYLKIGWITLKTSHHKAGNKNHELKIGDHYFCAGCYGGALGLIFGEIVGLIYLIHFNEPIKIIGLIAFSIGIVFILLSFTKYLREIFGWKRLLLNSCLAFGTWLIIIGIDIYFRNFYSVLYSLIVVAFIGIQRLTLSNLDHQINKVK